MSVKRRIEKLEQQTGGEDEPRLLIVFDNGDGTVTAQGETMTRAEWRERYQPRNSDHVISLSRL